MESATDSGTIDVHSPRLTVTFDESQPTQYSKSLMEKVRKLPTKLRRTLIANQAFGFTQTQRHNNNAHSVEETNQLEEHLDNFNRSVQEMFLDVQEIEPILDAVPVFNDVIELSHPRSPMSAESQNSIQLPRENMQYINEPRSNTIMMDEAPQREISIPIYEATRPDNRRQIVTDRQVSRNAFAQPYVSNTTSITNDQISIVKAAVSKRICDAFGPDGLKSGDTEEITNFEEELFQRLLIRKMVCDICMTHMKQYMCYKCLYSMCEGCKDKINSDSSLNVTCPHCREHQRRFLLIRVPNL